MNARITCVYPMTNVFCLCVLNCPCLCCSSPSPYLCPCPCPWNYCFCPCRLSCVCVCLLKEISGKMKLLNWLKSWNLREYTYIIQIENEKKDKSINRDRQIYELFRQIDRRQTERCFSIHIQPPVYLPEECLCLSELCLCLSLELCFLRSRSEECL